MTKTTIRYGDDDYEVVQLNALSTLMVKLDRYLTLVDLRSIADQLEQLQLDREEAKAAEQLQQRLAAHGAEDGDYYITRVEPGFGLYYVHEFGNATPPSRGYARKANAVRSARIAVKGLGTKLIDMTANDGNGKVLVKGKS